MKRLVYKLWAVIAMAACAGPVGGQEKPPTPDEALQRLKAGNARFVMDKLKEAELGSKARVQLVDKQRPIAAVLACADSRASPEIIFDKGLGVLFVLRLAGNVSGPAVLASMEYAAAELKTPLIVVLGHSNCGAVETALKNKAQPSDNLKHLIDLIHTGDQLPKDPEAAQDKAIRANVLYHKEQLTKQSTILKDFAANKRIKIVAAVYNLKTGEVEWLEEK